jgi:hypothetical protein
VTISNIRLKKIKTVGEALFHAKRQQTLGDLFFLLKFIYFIYLTVSSGIKINISIAKFAFLMSTTLE